MPSIDKDALRAARQIHAALLARQTEREFCLPESTWRTLQRLARHFDLVQERGWRAAARRLAEQSIAEANRLQWRLAESVSVMRAQTAPLDLPSEAEIYREILAVRREFDEFELDLAEHRVSVTVGPITLEDVYLGGFQIALDWRKLDTDSPYRVIALDPHPAASNHEAVHPHVLGDRLCEGDGRAAIQAALAQGRLLDFFLVVSRTLETYGAGSPYVALEHWEGVACEACGATIEREEACICYECGDRVCAECLSDCAGCGCGVCARCPSACAACGALRCSSCLARCADCRKRMCLDCLHDNLCGACHARRQERTEDAGSADDPGDREPDAGAECGSAGILQPAR